MALTMRITGRVQGVGFRWWTKGKADELGVSGWVRNRRDGSVEALLEGPAEAVDEMVRALHEGPPGAVVERLERSETVEPRALAGFEQRPTV